MKVVSLSLLALVLTFPMFAQSPQAPQTPAELPGQVQPVTTPQAQAPVTPVAPAAVAESPVPPDNSKIVVPAETTIPLILLSTINTRSAYVGQAIYCESIFPITVHSHIIIPKGSSIRGTLTQVVRPGRVKGRAQIGLRFDEIVLPNGTTLPLRGTLSGFGGRGKEDFNSKEGKITGPSSKGEDAGKVASTTISGAEIGTIAGAAKGNVGAGLGIGTAAGAAGGLIWVLASRGKDAVLPHGTSLELQLSAPLTFNRDDVERPTPYDQGPEMPHREYGPGA
jgi:type IV secretion system protein VirB10